MFFMSPCGFSPGIPTSSCSGETCTLDELATVTSFLDVSVYSGLCLRGPVDGF